MQQKLIAPTAEKYLSGVALNAGSSEETTDAQNADLQDRSGYLGDLFYLDPNMIQSFAFSEQHHVLRRGADVFESGFHQFFGFFCCFGCR